MISQKVVFPLVQYRALSPNLQIAECRFDHRVFDWKRSKFKVLCASQYKFIHPTNLYTIFRTENYSLLNLNHDKILNEAKQAHILPFQKTPFMFDPFGSSIFVLTDKNNFKHLAELQLKGKI